MNRLVLLLFAVALAVLISGCQPWQSPRASHESKVESCQAPIPVKLAAFDDFRGWGGNITTVRWWGVLLDLHQLGRPYFVAIYPNVAGACKPDLQQPIMKRCVEAQATQVGQDCQGKPVYRFVSNIPPVPTVNGQMYWIQISEADKESARPGLEDFRWSGTRPVRNCRALQMDAAGNIFTPLIDACDGAVNDLSFRVWP